MRTLRVLVQRIRGLWQQERIDADLHKEIADHLEEATEEYLKEGLSPAEARRAARISFGNVTQTEEAYREGRSLVWLERVARDARHAVRILWKQPALTVAVVGSLALGIGANAAIFSLLNGLLLKSLPVAQADRLVQVTPGGSFGAWTYPLWQELRDRQDVLDGVFAWSTQGTAFDLSTGGSVDVANGLWVSGSFFDVLGVQPAIGRTLVPADDARGGGPDGLVAVISHRFWQRRFAGAADVIGKTISIERVPFRIVGVTPAGFVGPNVGSAFDVAIPIGTQPIVLRRDRLDQRNWWWLNVMGRLKPGQTTEAAAAGLARLQPTLRDLTRPADVTARRSIELPEYADRRRAGARRAVVVPGYLPAGADRAHGHRRPRAPHRVRERRQPVAGSSRATPRQRQSSACARRVAPRTHSPIAPRESRALDAGRLGRTGDGALGWSMARRAIAVNRRPGLPGRVAGLARHRLHDGARHRGRDPVRDRPGVARDTRRSDGRA